MKILQMWAVLIICVFVVEIIDTFLGIDLTGFSFLAQIGHIVLYMVLGALVVVVRNHFKEIS